LRAECFCALERSALTNSIDATGWLIVCKVSSLGQIPKKKTIFLSWPVLSGFVYILGIHIDSTLSWKIHIEQIIPKLNAACYAMRSIKPFMSQETLKMVYHAYFLSIMNYGLIFWGNSSHSVNIFKLQKNIIRIITGCRSRDSCRELFKKLRILPLQSQYILSLLLFVVYNNDKFKLNSEVYNMNTRQKYNFHLPSSNLSVYQNGVYFTGIKVFNNLPQNIKNLGNDTKKFKSELKNYLHAHSFYSFRGILQCK
jgi:hypothetical protein